MILVSYIREKRRRERKRRVPRFDSHWNVVYECFLGFTTVIMFVRVWIYKNRPIRHILVVLRAGSHVVPRSFFFGKI